jgi:hypothetical protein
MSEPTCSPPCPREHDLFLSISIIPEDTVTEKKELATLKADCVSAEFVGVLCEVARVAVTNGLGGEDGQAFRQEAVKNEIPEGILVLIGHYLKRKKKAKYPTGFPPKFAQKWPVGEHESEGGGSEVC